MSGTTEQNVTGTVTLGINNIYTVKTDTAELECRIKGKQFKGDRVYNPLTVGDRVYVEPDSHDHTKGLITGREERKNVFSRLNKKRKAPQTILANIDILGCVVSASSPPFRPRFVDRVLVAAEIGDITPVIILNKADLEIDASVQERIKAYEDMGYRVFFTSALQHDGVDELRNAMKGEVWGVVGQSGVGKSSLLNALSPGLALDTGDISKKYNRGSHTTCYAAMFIRSDFTVIDTPGIREIDICGIEPMDLGHYFKDFQPYMGTCNFSPCLHDHEPGCRVKEAVEKDEIHKDRYESYIRILSQIKETGV